MKICFLAAADSIHSYRWISYFRDSGYEVTWISLRRTIFDVSGIEYFETSSVLKSIFLLHKILRQKQFNILHAHYAGTYGFIASLFKSAPFFLTVWGSDILINRNNFLKKFVLKRILQKANLITTDAQHMIEALKILGVTERKIFRINFGINTDIFIKGNEFRSGNHVLSTRSLEPIYDIDTLILAIPYVIQEIPNTSFTICGKGTQSHRLKKLSIDLGVDKYINFYGAISNEQILSLLQRSDIYVSTALSDAGIAASTAEAMATELPVIVTNSGENNLWIDDKTNGFLVDTRNYKQLAQKILILLRNKELRKTFGQNARQVIIAHNDYRTEMNKMRELYKKTITSVNNKD